MSSKFLHSIVKVEEGVVSDGVVQMDLSVNPLSFILVNLRPLNNTATLGDFASYLNIIGSINSLGIIFRGESIVRMTGRDLAALAYFRHGVIMPQSTHIDTNNFRRCVTLPIFLGREPYHPTSCFPSSSRGELSLEIDFDAVDTGYDGLRFNVEAVELLDAKPSEYERRVTITQTFAATGDNDVDLPVGNMYRGVLAFGTTGFTGATPVPTLGRMSARLNNAEIGYGATDFEVAHGLSSLWGRQPPAMDEHIHRVDATAANATEDTTLPSLIGSGGWNNYAYLDFDPTRDDRYAVSTSGDSRFNLRVNAESSDLVRVVGVERVKV